MDIKCETNYNLRWRFMRSVGLSIQKTDAVIKDFCKISNLYEISIILVNQKNAQVFASASTLAWSLTKINDTVNKKRHFLLFHTSAH